MVDLEKLAKMLDGMHLYGWPQYCRDLIAEVRALRAERDDYWKQLCATNIKNDHLARESDAAMARVGELEKALREMMVEHCGPTGDGSAGDGGCEGPMHRRAWAALRRPGGET
jgi:hypothetical protein